MQATAEKMTLRQWRVVKNIRVGELADAVGITPRTLSSYEKDINSLRNASYKNLEALADALGIGVCDIYLSPASEKPKFGFGTHDGDTENAL